MSALVLSPRASQTGPCTRSLHVPPRAPHSGTRRPPGTAWAAIPVPDWPQTGLREEPEGPEMQIGHSPLPSDGGYRLAPKSSAPPKLPVGPPWTSFPRPCPGCWVERGRLEARPLDGHCGPGGTLHGRTQSRAAPVQSWLSPGSGAMFDSLLWGPGSTWFIPGSGPLSGQVQEAWFSAGLAWLRSIGSWPMSSPGSGALVQSWFSCLFSPGQETWFRPGSGGLVQS